MLSYPRREGLWDSVVAGNIVQWVLDVEEVYADRALGRIPDWARMNSVQMNVNTWDREMYLFGYQQTSQEDCAIRKMEKTVKF